MGIFDAIGRSIGEWVQIIDYANSITIEDFSYATGVTGEMTEKHCEKCVSVNYGWFKNETGKKPAKHNTTGINVVDTLASLIPGLYHPRCHCQEISIVQPTEKSIELIVPEGKVLWLFQDKAGWVQSMGYENNQEFLNQLFVQIRRAYVQGNYRIIMHDKYGAKIDLYLEFPGCGNKIGKIYPLRSGFMIFPNGKLKCNTLIGGWYQ